MPHKKIKEFDIFFNLSIKKTWHSKGFRGFAAKGLIIELFLDGNQKISIFSMLLLIIT